MKFKRNGPLYVPERDPVRRYSPQDLYRYERYKERHQPRCAFTLIGSGVVATSSNANDVTTGGYDTTGANLIIVGAGAEGASVITDSNSNTWTPLTAVSGSFGIEAQFFYSYAPTVGAGHTFTNTLTGAKPVIGVLAYSGSASSPFHLESGAPNGGGNNGQPGALDPSPIDDELFVVLTTHFGSDTRTIDSGFTDRLQVAANAGLGSGLAMFDKIQTTAGSENPTVSWTNSGISYPIVMGTWKSGAAVTKSFPHSFENNLGNLMMR